MKNLLIMMIMAATAKAAITTNVVHIEEGAERNSEVFVTHEGRVFDIDSTNQLMLEKLKKAIENNLKIEIEVEKGVEFNSVNKVEKILSVTLIENEAVKLQEENLTPMDNYSASNVESYEKALEIFKSLNNKTKMFSQCFNRAHIWAKHMYDDYQVDSMKILIYYTKKYRKEVSRKWWFHIAPMVSINGEYHVMDREFTRKPVTATKWESIFTKKIKSPNYRCKKIDNIKEYYNDYNTKNEFCNIQYTSMYYWEPNDMSRLDKKGLKKTDWVNWELRVASKEAFKKWRKVYKKRKLN